MILRRRLREGINLAWQVGRSVAARWHSDMRAVRLLDGNRLITDVVNYCLPLDHRDTFGAADKKPQRTGRPLGLESDMKRSLAVSEQRGRQRFRSVRYF